jgi:hypothetical protein
MRAEKEEGPEEYMWILDAIAGLLRPKSQAEPWPDPRDQAVLNGLPVPMIDDDTNPFDPHGPYAAWLLLQGMWRYRVWDDRYDVPGITMEALWFAEPVDVSVVAAEMLAGIRTPIARYWWPYMQTLALRVTFPDGEHAEFRLAGGFIDAVNSLGRDGGIIRSSSLPQPAFEVEPNRAPSSNAGPTSPERPYGVTALREPTCLSSPRVPSDIVRASMQSRLIQKPSSDQRLRCDDMRSNQPIDGDRDSFAGLRSVL